jgi:hypothetical protein
MRGGFQKLRMNGRQSSDSKRGVIVTQSSPLSGCSPAKCWALIAGMLIAGAMPAIAQIQSGPSGAVTDTSPELRQLRSELDETRSQLSLARNQIDQLTTEVEALRREFEAGTPLPAKESPSASFPSAADVARQQQSGNPAYPSSVTELSDDHTLLAAQVEEQHQTKVESASKYRVKISGLVLINAFSNRGVADVAELPKLALESDDGSVGASVRQSLLGLQVFGPGLAGAATSASISADFFGGYPPQQPYGTTLGIMRLRTASAHLDWQDTSLIVGQEGLFFSPLSPTSYATLAEPALSYAGNLWAWTPQAVAEHRFHSSSQTYFAASGGLLAPLTEGVSSNQFFEDGQTGAGERARRPAFGSQLALNTMAFGQPAVFGIGEYASHLKYQYGRETNSWAVTAFWRVPFGPLFELSGEAYRGKAVGGLGGGIWQSVVYNGDPSAAGTSFRPLNAFGGWTQLKFHPRPNWEFNGAIGQDNVFAKDLEWAPVLVGAYMPPLARNRAAFGNVIFRPKSNLVLSVEYRKIWTYGYTGQRNSADQVNVGAGVGF